MFSKISTSLGFSDPGKEVECVLKDTVPFVPDVRYGRVVKVYDGDTITIGAKMYPIHNSQPIYRFSVRLNGIDTPELKGSGEEEHQVAVLARDWLANKIMGRMVALENVSFEKYGRLLATVYLMEKKKKYGISKWERVGEKLNSQIVKERLAVSYDGGTKEKVDWIAYHGGEFEFTSV